MAIGFLDFWISKLTAFPPCRRATGAGGVQRLGSGPGMRFDVIKRTVVARKNRVARVVAQKQSWPTVPVDIPPFDPPPVCPRRFSVFNLHTRRDQRWEFLGWVIVTNIPLYFSLSR